MRRPPHSDTFRHLHTSPPLPPATSHDSSAWTRRRKHAGTSELTRWKPMSSLSPQHNRFSPPSGPDTSPPLNLSSGLPLTNIKLSPSQRVFSTLKLSRPIQRTRAALLMRHAGGECYDLTLEAQRRERRSKYVPPFPIMRGPPTSLP